MSAESLPAFDYLRAGAEERRESLNAAKAFADAVRVGNVDAFLSAVDRLNHRAVDGWRLAMKRVARLHETSDEIRDEFYAVWIMTKMLPLTVGDRRALAGALRVLFPRQQQKPMRVYRGTRAGERSHRLYGFSWSENRETAKVFAQHWHKSGLGGIVLETDASAEAILQVIDGRATTFDEDEVVIDPCLLSDVRVVERLAAKAKGRK